MLSFLTQKFELSTPISPRNRIHIPTCNNMSIKGPDGLVLAEKMEVGKSCDTFRIFSNIL